MAGKTAQLATGGGGMAMDVLQVAAGKLHSGGGSITIGQVWPPVDGMVVSISGSHLTSFLAAV